MRNSRGRWPTSSRSRRKPPEPWRFRLPQKVRSSRPCQSYAHQQPARLRPACAIDGLDLRATGKVDPANPQALVSLKGSLQGEVLEAKAVVATTAGKREVRDLTLSLGPATTSLARSRSTTDPCPSAP